MTPKEKRDELIAKFMVRGNFKKGHVGYALELEWAKEYVRICCDEILFALKELDWDSDGLHSPDMEHHYNYWLDVKKEIEKL